MIKENIRYYIKLINRFEDYSNDITLDYFKDFIRYRIQLIVNAYNHPIFSGTELPKVLNVGCGVDKSFMSHSSKRIGWKTLEKIAPDLYNKALIYCGGDLS